MIRPLQEEVRSHLRSGVAITSLTQCVEELVLNSVDAGASNITVRVDIPNLKVQVSDNGCGITFGDLKLVGERYSSSKCHVLKDLEQLTFYGFRGEALASLREICDALEIVSRHRTSYQTYCKLFRNSQVLELTESRFPRTQSGTTVTIHNIFANLPVRRKSITEILDFERVRHRIASIALIHPKIAFLLINDSSGVKCLQTHVCKSSISTFSQLFGNYRSKGLQEVCFEHNDFKVSGFISTDTHHSKSLQFLFVNSRLVLKTKIHKLINSILGKSELLRKFTASEVSSSEPEGLQTKVTSSQSAKTSDNHGIYFLNIQCLVTEYEICLEPAKTLIEFQDWESVLYCVEKCIKDFLIKHNFSWDPEQADSREGNDNHKDGSCIISLEAFDYRREIETSDVRKSLHSSTVFRSRKTEMGHNVSKEATTSLQSGPSVSLVSDENHQDKSLSDAVEINSSLPASIHPSCSDSNSSSKDDFSHSVDESSTFVDVTTTAAKWLSSNVGEVENKHSDEQGNKVSKNAYDNTGIANYIRTTAPNSVKATQRCSNNMDCSSYGLSSTDSDGSYCFQNSQKAFTCQSGVDSSSCAQRNLLNELPKCHSSSNAYNSVDFSENEKAFDLYSASDKKKNLQATNVGTDKVCSFQSSNAKPRSTGSPSTASTRPKTKTIPTFTSPCPITLQGVYSRKRSQGNKEAFAINSGLPSKNRKLIIVKGNCKRRDRKNRNLVRQSTNANISECNEQSLVRCDHALQKTVDHGVNCKLLAANSDDISGRAMCEDLTTNSGVSNNDSVSLVPVSVQETCNSAVSVLSDQTASGDSVSQVCLFILHDKCKQLLEENSNDSVTLSDFNVRKHDCATDMCTKLLCSTNEREAKEKEVSVQQWSALLSAQTSLATSYQINNQGKESSLNDEWYCTFDASLGRNLFINTRTGHSSFEPPTESNVVEDNCTEMSVTEGVEAANDYRQHVPHPVASHLSFSCTPWLPREGRRQQLPSCDDEDMVCSKGMTQVAAMYKEHHDVQGKDDKLCKWTDADALETYEQSLFNSGSHKTVADMLECWQNPVFPTPAQDILKANKPGNCSKNQICIHNVVHPYRFTREMLAGMTVLRQLDDKFIVGVLLQEGEDDGLLVLVDQHAAHERVRLEHLQSELFEDGNNSQTSSAKPRIKSSPVSPPMEVTFFAEEIRLLRKFQSEVERIGIHFGISESSQRSEETLVFVSHVPSVLVEREVSEVKRGRPSVAVSKVKGLIREHLEHLSMTCGVPALIPKVISEVISSQACHGAIKFGEPLGVSECQELIDRLSKCRLPFQCAHGRPSVIPLADLRFLRQKMASKQEASRPKMARLLSALVQEH